MGLCLDILKSGQPVGVHLLQAMPEGPDVATWQLAPTAEVVQVLPNVILSQGGAVVRLTGSTRMSPVYYSAVVAFGVSFQGNGLFFGTMTLPPPLWNQTNEFTIDVALTPWGPSS